MTKWKETEIGNIPEDWEVITIADLFTVKNGKTNSQDAVENGKYPLFDRSTVIKFSNKYLFDSEAIIIPGEGKEFMPHCFLGKFDLHQRVYAIMPKTAQVCLRFFYYWMYYDRDYLARIAVGSTVKSLRLNHLTGFPAPKPALSEQQAIAKILSDLDSKIELSQQMNKTLESIAQAIFKHWFIDFEFPDENGKPYKSSGGEMVDSELGEIPKGWTISELGNFVNFVKGRKSTVTSTVPVNGYSKLILIETLNGGEPTYVPVENSIQVTGEVPIMVMDGASSGRIEIGHVGVLGSTLSKLIIENDTLTYSYLYCFLKNLQEDINQNTTGTSIPHTDKERIRKYRFALPPFNLLSLFERIWLFVLRKQINNREEVHLLSEMRDLLLPRLMSGKIRVPLEE